MAIKQPADKSHFILPDLGEGVHEAELIRWRVKPGETVEEHQVLAEMETDKALVEVPSPWAGTIRNLNGKEGEILNVGSILVEYEGGGGSSKAAKPAPAAAADGAQDGSDHGEREDAGTVVGSVGDAMTISDRFARRRPEADTAAPAGKALATPAVRRIARDAGVDIDRVPGTGRGGRVTASDIQSFIAGGAVTAPSRTAAPAPAQRMEATTVPTAITTAPAADLAPVNVPQDGVIERIPFRGVRRKIAEALDRSVKTAVHFTVVDEVDVTRLEVKRAEYARLLGRKISLLPFVMTAVCRALRAHPMLNVNVDDGNSDILVKGVYNLGCAVDTDHGLMVPVIHGADRMSVVQLGEAVAALAKACRDRTIPRESLMGGTFTISNVGSYGGMFATPIINYPEVGILGVGRTQERVLVKDGAFYAGKVLPLSMSCDHRVVDGAEGARFLNTVKRLLEAPDDLLGTG